MMAPDLSRVPVWVRPGVTDMRKAANGLSLLVAEQMDIDPLSGALVLFCNRERRIMKAVWWDRNGFCLWQKKLEHDRYPWPMTTDAARKITPDQLSMLLDGIDFWHAHSRQTYERVS